MGSRIVNTRDHFESKYTPVTESGCWLWDKGDNGCGYGAYHVRRRYIAAHRMAWKLYRGDIPEGMQVLHRCDVRACVNPNHLFLGTNEDNQKDKVEKKRHPHGESNASAKLTLLQAREIRRLRLDGYNAKELAVRFGVTLATIYAIARNLYWKEN